MFGGSPDYERKIIAADNLSLSLSLRERSTLLLLPPLVVSQTLSFDGVDQL